MFRLQNHVHLSSIYTESHKREENMDVDLNNIELLDIVKEIRVDLVIEYYTATISLKEEHLQMMKDTVSLQIANIHNWREK